MKALVLAGGTGTRLRPLTYTMAKQLVPVANKPVLHYVIQHLADDGIKQIGVIIAPETGEQIRNALSSNPWDVNFTFIEQAEPLGLAHAVKVSRDFLGDDPFIMYLGDNLLEEGIGAFRKRFEDSGADSMILLKEVDDPRLFGVAAVDDDGRVYKLVEKPEKPPSNLGLVGVYLFSPLIHQAIDEIEPSGRGELEITDAIQKLLDQGRNVNSLIVKGWWLDTGKKDDMLEANRVVLDQWVKSDLNGEVDDESRVAGRVVLGHGGRIIRSTVRGPAVIGAGSIIEDAFIGPSTSIGEDCIVRNTSLEHCVLLDGVTIEDAGRVEDSILGRNAVVRRTSGNHEALHLMVGDDAEVLL
ncbi:MAG: glucose-1-phosphate thymidylyltransferase [Acidobacteriota bacterium]|nr:glucose-1-phosphate thymidylyltransferase [Acidobacteriota bacterium]MEE3150921.1 glucose-1-phosphate thymidylyltransferase [Acidobacteriota bacterium]